MNNESLFQAARAVGTALKDALLRALTGSIFAVWVPPAVTFLVVALLYVYQQFLFGRFPIWEVFVNALIGGLAIAGLAFIMGVIGLFVVGIPVLFCLTLIRATHPLVACVGAASLTYWRIVLSPPSGQPFAEDGAIFIVVAAITGYVAAKIARSHAPAI